MLLEILYRKLRYGCDVEHRLRTCQSAWNVATTLLESVARNRCIRCAVPGRGAWPGGDCDNGQDQEGPRPGQHSKPWEDHPGAVLPVARKASFLRLNPRVPIHLVLHIETC